MGFQNKGNGGAGSHKPNPPASSLLLRASSTSPSLLRRQARAHRHGGMAPPKNSEL
jgi:hypothetical protein